MSHNRLSNLTIVVVEDHDDTRRFLGNFLGRLGANVVLARNAPILTIPIILTHIIRISRILKTTS
jgi:CheY-like chemotaxis protein